MGFILSQILKKKVPEWNTKIFDEESLTAAAAVSGARVVDLGIRSKGEYVVHRDYSFIILRRDLRRHLRPWVLAHELGHHLLHAVANHKFSKSTIRRYDREANFFAAIALIPTTELPRIHDLAEEFAYPMELVRIREEIFREFRL